MSKLLKVGGIDYNKQAKPLHIGKFGEINTKQYPNMSNFLGSVNEPISDGHIGSFGVFGVEVVRTGVRLPTPVNQRYDIGIRSVNGSVYFISKADKDTDMYRLDFFSLSSGESGSTALWYSSGGAYPSTIIDFSDKIAVVNREGVGELFLKSDLTKVKDIKWDKTAYVDGSKTLSSNPTAMVNTVLYGDGEVHVLSANQINTYDLSAVEKSKIKFSELFEDQGVYFSSLRSFVQDKYFIYVSGVLSGGSTSLNGSCIAIIRKSTKKLVKLLNKSGDYPSSTTPVAVASEDFGLYTIERSTGLMYKWTVTESTETFEFGEAPVLEVADDISTSNAAMFIDVDGSQVAIRTGTRLALIDIDIMNHVWLVKSKASAITGSVSFDGLGHVVFEEDNGTMFIVNKFLQVQGYGVKS